eukprot:gene4080-4632_t
MFLRSVEKGLRDDNILTKFHSVLQTTKITDEELIQQMSSISSAEAERQARIGKKVEDQMNAAVIDDRKTKETEQRRFRHQEPDRQEEADSTDEENNVPSFKPNVLPHVLEELESNYTEEHDNSEEPRANTDNDIVPENVSQSIPSADASEDRYQPNATSDEIPSQPLAEDSGEQVSLENATDNSIDEDAHSILGPL